MESARRRTSEHGEFIMENFSLKFREPSHPITWRFSNGRVIERNYNGYQGLMDLTFVPHPRSDSYEICLTLSYQHNRRTPLAVSCTLTIEQLYRTSGMGMYGSINTLLSQFVRDIQGDERDVAQMSMRFFVDRLQFMIPQLPEPPELSQVRYSNLLPMLPSGWTSNYFESVLGTYMRIPQHLVSSLDTRQEMISMGYEQVLVDVFLSPRVIHRTSDGGRVIIDVMEPTVLGFDNIDHRTRVMPVWDELALQRVGPIKASEEEANAERLLNACFPDARKLGRIVAQSKKNPKLQYQLILSQPEQVYVFHQESNNLGYLCLEVGNGVCKLDRAIQRMLFARDKEDVLWRDSYFHPMFGVSDSVVDELLKEMGGRRFGFAALRQLYDALDLNMATAVGSIFGVPARLIEDNRRRS